MVGTRVYVGGLPYGTTERDLERFFRGYGRMRDVLIKSGYGFVEFDDHRDADDAVYELNGKKLLGERVTVEKARGTPRGRDQWTGSSRSDHHRSHDRYGPPTRTKYRLIVENLSSRVSWQDLKDYMRQAGEVTYADAHKLRRNEGVVEFASYSDMKSALDKLDDTDINGRRIRLVEDRSDKKSRSRSYSSRSRSRSGKRSRSRSRSSRSRSKSRSGEKNNKSKSRSRSNSRKKSVNRSRSNSRKKSGERSRSGSPPTKRARSGSQSKRSRSRSASKRSRSRSVNNRSRSRSASKRSRSRSANKRSRSRSVNNRSRSHSVNNRSRSQSREKRSQSRERSLENSKERSRSRSRSRSHSKERSKSRSHSPNGN